MCRARKCCGALIVMLRDIENLTFTQIRQITGYKGQSISNVIAKRCKHKHRIDCKEQHALIGQIENEYLAGASTYLLAEKYAVSRSWITKNMKKRGHVRYKGFMPEKNELANHLEKVRKNGETWFDRHISDITCGKVKYVGGFTKIGCIVTVKCTVCGHVFERYANRGALFKCPHCEEENRKAKNEVKKEERRNQLIKKRKTEMKVPKTCKHCMQIFYSEFPSAVYCSKKCRKRAQSKRNHERDRVAGRSSSHRSRARKAGVAYDPAITLKKLWNRDGGICQICGMPCNWEDKAYGASGPTHPSIDHIVPLSKGGSHTWGNVQLAHHYCNSIKSDSVEGVLYVAS